MYTTINEFRKYLKENIEVVAENKELECLQKILNQIVDLKDLDILCTIIEDGRIISMDRGGSDTYMKFHRELVPTWAKGLWMDKLKSGGESMDNVYKYANVFQEYIKEKGYDSQECFLTYNLGHGDNEVSEAFSDISIDFDNLDQSVNELVSKIKSTEVYHYYRGFFVMGFDVMAKEGEENGGFAAFAFKTSSPTQISTFKMTDSVTSIRPEDESDVVEATFMPNTDTFYRYKTERPYKDLADLYSEEGFVLRLD